MKSGETIICDECDYEEDFPSGTPWEEIKDYGWRAFKKDGCWFHACLDCVRNFSNGKVPEKKETKKASNPEKKAFEVVMEALEGRGFSGNEAQMLIRKAKQQ